MRFRIRAPDETVVEFDASTAAQLSGQLSAFLNERSVYDCFLDVRAGRQWFGVHAHAYGLANYALTPSQLNGAWQHAEKTMLFYEEQVRVNRRLGMSDPDDIVHDLNKGRG